MVHITNTTLGSLPAIEFRSERSGSCMKVCLFGATVYSFSTTDGKERLFLSKSAVLDGTKPIRGGIPIVFPQFGAGKLPNHGFARTSTWTYEGYELEDEKTRLAFHLTSTKQTHKNFPFAFVLQLRIEFDSTGFKTELRVKNESDNTEGFHFQCLLHTYFRLDNVEKVFVSELKGVKFIDQLKDYGDKLHIQSSDIVISKETDNIYKLSNKSSKQLKPKVFVNDKTTKKPILSVEVSLKSFREEPTDNEKDNEKISENQNIDIVVWNPWIKKAKSLSDFGDEEYKNMLCIEPGCVSRYENCLSGETWALTQTVKFY